MKESIVEIPKGSGNRYRYAYEEGKTRYLGPVGDAPPLGEEEFSKIVWSGPRPGDMLPLDLEDVKDVIYAESEHLGDRAHLTDEIVDVLNRFDGSKISKRMANALQSRLEPTRVIYEKNDWGAKFTVFDPGEEAEEKEFFLSHAPGEDYRYEIGDIERQNPSSESLRDDSSRLRELIRSGRIEKIVEQYNRGAKEINEARDVAFEGKRFWPFLSDLIKP